MGRMLGRKSHVSIASLLGFCLLGSWRYGIVSVQRFFTKLSALAGNVHFSFLRLAWCFSTNLPFPKLG